MRAAEAAAVEVDSDHEAAEALSGAAADVIAIAAGHTVVAVGAGVVVIAADTDGAALVMARIGATTDGRIIMITARTATVV